MFVTPCSLSKQKYRGSTSSIPSLLPALSLPTHYSSKSTMDVIQSRDTGRTIKEITRNNTEANWGTQELKTFGNVDAARKDILTSIIINTLNAELNPICHLLALLGAHHILHISRIRVKAVMLIYKLH
jgi:hypothetical protein